MFLLTVAKLNSRLRLENFKNARLLQEWEVLPLLWGEFFYPGRLNCIKAADAWEAGKNTSRNRQNGALAQDLTLIILSTAVLVKLLLRATKHNSSGKKRHEKLGSTGEVTLETLCKVNHNDARTGILARAGTQAWTGTLVRADTDRHIVMGNHTGTMARAGTPAQTGPKARQAHMHK